jgi:hypothetical protein
MHPVLERFLHEVETGHAYNGAPDPGQRFYDWGLNPWLRQIAEEFIREGRIP